MYVIRERAETIGDAVRVGGNTFAKKTV